MNFISASSWLARKIARDGAPSGSRGRSKARACLRGAGGRFERLDKLRIAAVRRLLRLPAADLPALSFKLEIAVAEEAWEGSGSEDCLANIAADARRLSEIRRQCTISRSRRRRIEAAE